jgi:hypothetical protein
LARETRRPAGRVPEKKLDFSIQDRMMKTVILVTSFVAIVSLLSSCEDNGSGTGVGPAPSGAYRYASYDTNGTAVVQGWLTIMYQDSGHITGEWNLEKIGNPQGIGPQVGTGNLVGSFYEGKLFIELNPQFRDNNLQLAGEVENGYYGGQWFWISFAGISGRGTFEAVRN